MNWQRLLLCVASLLVFVIANIPAGQLRIGFSYDKLNHIIAFGFLAFTAILAFPRLRLVWVFISLMLFNVGIELSQAVLGQGREPDIGDWLAGAMASLCILAVFQLYRQRKLRRS